jgi:hypothetical protein
VYLLTRSGNTSSKGRWIAQSFLRNGVGASLDIAVGPNPPVSLLDMVVLASLQAWSFEVHWMPAGIGDDGLPALERLIEAKMDTWASARAVLSKEQESTLSGLIDAWIAENPDRTVVALVRFDEFIDERRISSLSLRGKAHGLLREVSEVGEAVDEARLLGERLLWFAGRYPYLIGEQTELTAYRLIDQPEGAEIMDAIRSAKRLSEAMTERIGTIQGDLTEQQAAFFSQISTERSAAIAQLESALQNTVMQSLARAHKDIRKERIEAIQQLFDRLSQERKLLLDDIVSRQDKLLGVMSELHQTVEATGTLAEKLTDTVNAIDRVVSRFDTDPEDQREPLQMADVRDAAVETGRAAERTTRMLERSIELLESPSWGQRLTDMTAPAKEVIDYAFWRALILIGFLILCIGLLRIVPRRKL